MSQEIASSTELGVGKTVHVQKNKTSPNWGFVQKSKLRPRPCNRRKCMTRKAGEEILFKEEAWERQGRKIAEAQRRKSRYQPEFISIIKGELCVIFQEFLHLWKEQRMWNIQSTYKIMASGPTTSWEIDGETVSDFILLGSKITADGNCSLEIKRHLLLGRKVMTNLDSILKNRDIFANKGPSSQG